MTTAPSLSRHRTLARPATLGLFVGGAIALGGCALEPHGPTPISRLPADRSGLATGARPLTPEERARYDAIDRQALADQDRAIARERSAQALARAYAPPVTLYGGYFGGGWGGPSWSVGFGNAGWGPAWGPGWGRPGWGRPGWRGPAWSVSSGFPGWGWGGGSMGWGMGWGW